MWDGSTKPNATGGDVPACLCKQVMRRRWPVRPVMRRSSVTGEFILFCPSCKIRTYPSTNKQSVIAEWCGMNRPGDPHIEQLWQEKFDFQQQQPVNNPHPA